MEGRERETGKALRDRRVHVSRIDCAIDALHLNDSRRFLRCMYGAHLALPCIVSLRASLPHVIAALFVIGLAQACGGKTLVGIEPDDDSGITTDSGVGTGTTDDGAECVDLEVASSDLSCVSDQDCVPSLTGKVCEGQCACGDTSVNAAAAARYQSETASLTLEACPCPAQGEPRCLGGQCTLCGFGPNQPAGCDDSGITTIEDGGIFDGNELDSPISVADAGT